jgi:hypothetical protein
MASNRRSAVIEDERPNGPLDGKALASGERDPFVPTEAPPETLPAAPPVALDEIVAPVPPGVQRAIDAVKSAETRTIADLVAGDKPTPPAAAPVAPPVVAPAPPAAPLSLKGLQAQIVGLEARIVAQDARIVALESGKRPERPRVNQAPPTFDLPVLGPKYGRAMCPNHGDEPVSVSLNHSGQCVRCAQAAAAQKTAA